MHIPTCTLCLTPALIPNMFIADGIQKTRTWYQPPIFSRLSAHIYSTLSVMTVTRGNLQENNGGRRVKTCRKPSMLPLLECLARIRLENRYIYMSGMVIKYCYMTGENPVS